MTELLNNTTTNLNNLLIKHLIFSILVPEGNSDKDNEEVFRSGETPDLNGCFATLGVKKFDIIDFELGGKITGAGFPVYVRKGARLQRALINYFR